MKEIASLPLLITSLLTSGIVLPAFSQVRSDRTTNTTINQNGNNFEIINGIQKGNNLFHSFQEFSIPTRGSVTFQNSSTIVNIINRVTGGNISNIDGLIKANASASVFLINPAGIVFGENAQLDIGGSFLASTAESILFADGFNFSARVSDEPRLLTINVPIGLQFGSTANPIIVDKSYLAVSPGKSLGFLGGEFLSEGSILAAQEGQLSLGSVAPGSQVGFDSNTFEMDYSNTKAFQDITLTQGTIANVSGDGGGSFQFQSRVFQLSDNSFAIADNLGPSDGNKASIRASERIDLIGTGIAFSSFISVDVFGTGKGNHLIIETDSLRLSDGAFVAANTFDRGSAGGITINAKDVSIFGNPDGNGSPTAMVSDTFGGGRGGDITIIAEQLIGQGRSNIFANSYGVGINAGDSGNISLNVDKLALRNGFQIATTTFGDGNAGNLTAIATESVEIKGFNTFLAGNFSSGLFSNAQPGSTGNAGSLSIITPQLSILQGSKVAVNTLGSGNGGNITIRASEIEVADPIIDFGGATSGLVANVVTNGSGNGGSLDIETKYLNVYNGGQITVSTDGMGNAGTIDIRADKIDIGGKSDDGLFSSAITSSSTTNFDAGSINIEGNQVNIRDGAEISVSSLSGGNAGNLNVNADIISLDNQGSLQANVALGNRGNLNLTSQFLLLRNNSNITTSATATASGGNININSPIILGLENSDIIANAVQGNGGNINITTQGIFGIEFRDQLTEESDITASSEFGVNGTVKIRNFDVDPNSGLVELPLKFNDSSQQINQRCFNNTGNSFVATRRGGIPHNPKQSLNLNSTWFDLRNFSVSGRGNNNNSEIIDISSKPEIVEATGFIRNENGEIELVNLENKPFPAKQVTNCIGLTKTYGFNSPPSHGGRIELGF